MRAAAVLCAMLLSTAPLWPADSRVVIEDTGSTNRPGMRVSVDKQGHALVESRSRPAVLISLDARQCKQFLRALKKAGRLHELPAKPCMKSASFGSSLFVESESDRSPDLSCPAQDKRAAELQRQALAILGAARKAAGVPLHRAL